MDLFKTRKIFPLKRINACRAILKISHKSLEQPVEISLVRHAIINGNFKFVLFDYLNGQSSKILNHLCLNNQSCKAELFMYGPSAPGYGDDDEPIYVFKSSFGMSINDIKFKKYNNGIDPEYNRVTMKGRITYEFV